MINIVIVDDNPEFKVLHAMKYLEERDFVFQYEIFTSVNESLRYILQHFKTIDLIILDLGLPLLPDEYCYDRLNGLQILQRMCYKKINIPVIINSDTKIPTELEYFKSLRDTGMIIEHVESLNGNWLEDFIKRL